MLNYTVPTTVPGRPEALRDLPAVLNYLLLLHLQNFNVTTHYQNHLKVHKSPFFIDIDESVTDGRID